MKRLLIAMTVGALLSAAAPASARIPDDIPCCRAGTSGKVAAPRRPLPIVKSCCQAGTRGNTGIVFAN